MVIRAMLKLLSKRRRSLARAALRPLTRVSWIRRVGGRLLAGRPALKARVRRMLHSADVGGASYERYALLYAIDPDANLPESARRIYEMLLKCRRK